MQDILLVGGSVVADTQRAKCRADLIGASRIFCGVGYYRSFSHSQAWDHWSRRGVFREVLDRLPLLELDEMLDDPHYLAHHDYRFIP